MTNGIKKKRLRPAGNARYGSFVSVGNLLGVKSPGLKNTIKLEFLPQWEEKNLRAVEAVLSKRSLLVDVRASELSLDDIKKLASAGESIRRAANEHPNILLRIVQAFGGSGTKEERKKALERAQSVGLWKTGDSEPVAFWGGLLLVGAAILIAGCCNETDTECDSEDDTDGESGEKPD